MGENGNGLTVADALALRNDSDGFGGGNSWWAIILILLFAFGGWNNGGWNNGNGANTVVVPTGDNFSGYNACCTPATQQGLTTAFNFSQLEGDIRGVGDAVSSGFYNTNLGVTTLGSNLQQSIAAVDRSNLQSFGDIAMGMCQNTNTLLSSMNTGNNAIQMGMNTNTNNIQSALCNGFNGVQSALAQTNYNQQNCCCETREAIMQSNFANQTGFNNLQTAVASNACDIERGQETLRTAMVQQTNEILANQDRNADRIINHMVQTEMDNLRTELQNAKFQISQGEQTANIIGQLNPAPVPAYPVSNYYRGWNNGNYCNCNG